MKKFPARLAMIFSSLAAPILAAELPVVLHASHLHVNNTHVSFAVDMNHHSVWEIHDGLAKGVTLVFDGARGHTPQCPLVNESQISEYHVPVRPNAEGLYEVAAVLPAKTIETIKKTNCVTIRKLA